MCFVMIEKKATIATSILVQKPHKQVAFFYKNKFCWKLDALQINSITREIYLKYKNNSVEEHETKL